MDTKTLRYQVELAMSGMKDGPPSQYRAPVRLEQLLNYKKSWPALSWSKEDTLVVSRPTIIGVSGGFFYHASERSGQHYQWVLEIYELRSFRIGRTTSTLRHYKFNVTFDIQSVVIDPSQNLLVLVELDQPYKYVISLSDPRTYLTHCAVRIRSQRVCTVATYGHATFIHVPPYRFIPCTTTCGRYRVVASRSRFSRPRSAVAG